MQLIKSEWKPADKAEFLEFLKSKGRPEKVQWTTNIINTKLPVLAILSPEISAIVKEIVKGNFISFLDLKINDYYESVVINGNLIMKIADCAVLEKYLTEYAENAENWAVCDLLKFKITDKNKQRWWDLAVKYIASELPFVRRIGIDILFGFISDSDYIDGIFNILNGFENEEEYYVNMVNAWLIAECFAKQRDKTLKFLSNHRLNKFTINKAISKCRDSYRVTPQDKQMLLSFKIK